MRLSTMTNLIYRPAPDGRSFIHAVRLAHKVGFRVMDFNMCPLQRGETELAGDNWQELVYEIADEAAGLGIEFSQSHLPYPKASVRRRSNTDEGCERNEFFMRMTERAVSISGMLGVKWAVVHPVQRGMDTDFDDDLKYNHEIYDRYFEATSAAGVGLAFENMADVDAHRRFGTTPAELNAIVASYDSPYAGICWDFGHANRTYADQCAALREAGPALRATHLDDNLGKDDLHTVPFIGTVKWPQVMNTLRQVNYSGDLTYELSVYRRMPDELLLPTVEYVYKVGQYLMSL